MYICIVYVYVYKVQLNSVFSSPLLLLCAVCLIDVFLAHALTFILKHVLICHFIIWRCSLIPEELFSLLLLIPAFFCLSFSPPSVTLSSPQSLQTLLSHRNISLKTSCFIQNELQKMFLTLLQISIWLSQVNSVWFVLPQITTNVISHHEAWAEPDSGSAHLISDFYCSVL